jgi:hypothetical protein
MILSQINIVKSSLHNASLGGHWVPMHDSIFLLRASLAQMQAKSVNEHDDCCATVVAMQIFYNHLLVEVVGLEERQRIAYTALRYVIQSEIGRFRREHDGGQDHQGPCDHHPSQHALYIEVTKN